MADHQIALRDGILDRLRNDSAVTALVPEARIYSEQPPDGPAWPFIRWGFPIVDVSKPDCWELASYDLTIHVFAKETEAVGGMENAVNIANAVARALDDASIDMAGGAGCILLVHTGNTLLRDTTESGAYHALVSLTAATAEVVA